MSVTSAFLVSSHPVCTPMEGWPGWVDLGPWDNNNSKQNDNYTTGNANGIRSDRQTNQEKLNLRGGDNMKMVHCAGLQNLQELGSNTKAQFPLAELTARVDGWPVSITRQHGPVLSTARNTASGKQAPINTGMKLFASTSSRWPIANVISLPSQERTVSQSLWPFCCMFMTVFYCQRSNKWNEWMNVTTCVAASHQYWHCVESVQ